MDVPSSPQHLAVGEVHNVPNEAPKEIKKPSYASTILFKQSGPANLELCPVLFNNGEPVIQFTKEEVNDFIREEGLHQAVVIKFSYGRPDLLEVRRILPSQFDVQGHCNIGHLEFRHLLIRFDLHNDYVHFLSKSTGYLKSKSDEYFFRTFPWSLDFNPKEETSMAVVWISLPGLPPNFFAKRSLLSIASVVGKPLAVDKATQDRSRPSAARVKVIVNLLDNHPKKVNLQIFDRISGKSVEIHQQIVFDNLPKYCVYCKHQGHDDKSCRIKKQNIGAEVDAEAHLSGQKCDDLVKLQGDAREFLNAKRDGQGVKVSQTIAGTSETELTRYSQQNVQSVEGGNVKNKAVVQDDVAEMFSVIQSGKEKSRSHVVTAISEATFAADSGVSLQELTADSLKLPINLNQMNRGDAIQQVMPMNALATKEATGAQAGQNHSCNVQHLGALTSDSDSNGTIAESFPKPKGDQAHVLHNTVSSKVVDTNVDQAFTCAQAGQYHSCKVQQFGAKTCDSDSNGIYVPNPNGDHAQTSTGYCIEPGQLLEPQCLVQQLGTQNNVSATYSPAEALPKTMQPSADSIISSAQASQIKGQQIRCNVHQFQPQVYVTNLPKVTSTNHPTPKGDTYDSALVFKDKTVAIQNPTDPSTDNARSKNEKMIKQQQKMQSFQTGQSDGTSLEASDKFNIVTDHNSLSVLSGEKTTANHTDAQASNGQNRNRANDQMIHTQLAVTSSKDLPAGDISKWKDHRHFCANLKRERENTLKQLFLFENHRNERVIKDAIQSPYIENLVKGKLKTKWEAPDFIPSKPPFSTCIHVLDTPPNIADGHIGTSKSGAILMRNATWYDKKQNVRQIPMKAA